VSLRGQSKQRAVRKFEVANYAVSSILFLLSWDLMVVEFAFTTAPIKTMGKKRLNFEKSIVGAGERRPGMLSSGENL
jgi:hypothetical protein